MPHAGIRNTVGHDFHPDTGVLYFTNNGCDQFGDNAPDDCLNVVDRAPAFYGFPYCHVTGYGSPYLRLPGGEFNYTLDPEFNPTPNDADHMAYCEGALLLVSWPLPGPPLASLQKPCWISSSALACKGGQRSIFGFVCAVQSTSPSLCSRWGRTRPPWE